MTQPVMNKAFIDGRIYDVMDQKDFGVYSYSGDALAINVGNFILPVRNTTQISKPGIYFNGIFYRLVMPRDEMEALEYSTVHLAYFVSPSIHLEPSYSRHFCINI